MAETNNKFLQILRNFSSADRTAAIAQLKAAANSGTLYHAGTPIVAFYNQGDSADPKGENITFPARAQNGGYGTAVTRNYQALLGIMGKSQGQIEIFDIQSSVDALLGSATDGVTLSSVNNPSATWNFRSLGAIQVVIEAMDGFITASLDDLNDRITAITGQDRDTYSANTDAHYIDDATDLQNAVDQLDSEVYAISQTVASQRLESPDGTITINTPQGSDHTNVDVHIKTGEDVLRAAANDAGLETVINITALTDAQIAALSDSDKANIRAAYKLTGIDGTTQKGDLIKIYKDSALTNVYLGTMGDTLSGQDAQSGESASSTVVPGTGSESLNFVYHLENGNYKMEKVDVETFLQESEFGNGLQVETDPTTLESTHVVSVKVDDNSEEVITAYGASAAQNTTAPVLSVGANGVKVDNIQAAIDAAVAHGGTSIINSTMTATTDGTVTVASVAETAQHVYIRQGTDASGAKTYEFLETDIASEDALNAEVTRAQTAEGEIADLVGLGGTEGSRTYTPVVTPETGETAATTVKEDIALLDAHVDALNNALNGLDSSKAPVADSALAGFVEVDGKVYGTMTTMPQVTEGVTATSETNSTNAYVKVTKTNATAATISADGQTVTDGTGASYAIATTVALDNAIANAKTVVTGEADSTHGTQTENGVYVTKTAGSGATPDTYLVAIDVFDCGEYTVS